MGVGTIGAPLCIRKGLTLVDPTHNLRDVGKRLALALSALCVVIAFSVPASAALVYSNQFYYGVPAGGFYPECVYGYVTDGGGASPYIGANTAMVTWNRDAGSSCVAGSRPANMLYAAARINYSNFTLCNWMQDLNNSGSYYASAGPVSTGGCGPGIFIAGHFEYRNSGAGWSPCPTWGQGTLCITTIQFSTS